MSLNLELFAGIEMMLTAILVDTAVETAGCQRAVGGSLTAGAAGWNPRNRVNLSPAIVRLYPALSALFRP